MENAPVLSSSQEVSPENLDVAFAAWSIAVGSENLERDGPAIVAAQTATFATRQKVYGIVRPGSRDEVTRCLAVANKYRIPIYPRSSGRNWGYGSSVPPRDAVVLDLARMNGIVDFNEDLAYVTLEPGVTQTQLYEFLRKRGSRLWMDATGSSPHCSIIGNTVERGFGHTPYGDHFANVCGLEVVLATGHWLRTGFGRFANASAAPVYRWGVGPYLDGLFTQSNLGIVTQMTVWLMPAPEYFQAFFFSIAEDYQLEALVDALRPLRLDGTIRSAVHIGNDFKVLSSIQRYPWTETNGRTPLPLETLARFRKQWDFGAWNGSGALYGTRLQVAAARQRIRQALRGKVRRLRFLDDRALRFGELIKRPYHWLTRVNIGEMLKLVRPVYELMKGVPTGELIASTYWRKRTIVPAQPDPDRDRCGLLWCSPVSPTEGRHARAMADIVRDVFSSYSFEPAMSMTLINERSLDNVICISYDRDVEGEDARAMRCYHELSDRLAKAGYYSYRLGIHSTTQSPASIGHFDQLVSGVRQLTDPNHILAPGRYE